VTEFRDRDPASILSYYREVGAVYERLAELPQPTLAAIHGYCLGGGLELALACDFRVAEESAVFGFPEVSLGILPSSGGVHRLVRAVGPSRAKELILLRPRFRADEAKEYGLLAEVVPEGQAMKRSLQLAAELAELPPLAVSVTKDAIRVAAESSRDAALLVERLSYAMLAQTADADEAAAAFVEKREPRFRGA
jgi:enoyl-CoA hydratase/carnithine racemase